jgi:hypothetical protein
MWQLLRAIGQDKFIPDETSLPDKEAVRKSSFDTANGIIVKDS